MTAADTWTWVDASETEPCIVIDRTGFTGYAKPAG